MFLKENPDVDIIIDDGGHQYFQQALTFFVFYATQKKNTVYRRGYFDELFSNFLEQNEEKLVSFEEVIVFKFKANSFEKGLSAWRNDMRPTDSTVSTKKI